MASAFDEFVERKTRKADPVDWAARREKWLGKLAVLNASVSSFLKDFTDTGAIQLTLRPITLHEEAIGSYEAKTLLISIGESAVELRPKGTILFGGIGRADLIGPSSEIMIVLAPKGAEGPRLRILTADEAAESAQTETNWDDWIWKIAVRQPTLRYIELDKQSFQEALMTVAN